MKHEKYLSKSLHRGFAFMMESTQLSQCSEELLCREMQFKLFDKKGNLHGE